MIRKAFILAAGLGTRLKPWTLRHPKALVPVDGIPMLERVISRLKQSGFNYIVINVHHFADQIEEFLKSKDYGIAIKISDESDKLMDTGGGIVKAAEFLKIDSSPFLIHNVDILSNADPEELFNEHLNSNADATLLTSFRESSRKLVSDKNNILKGWKNLSTSETRPRNLMISNDDSEVSFSGIHVMNIEEIEKMFSKFGDVPFPIMDYYLSSMSERNFRIFKKNNLSLIDIGKPETLEEANMKLKLTQN